MKSGIVVGVFALVFTAQLFAVERIYQTATITNVEQKTNTRVLYYVVNTPITKDEPYFEISVQLKDTIYLARYTPRHANDELPDEWKSGASVQARIEGRHLFLKRPSGSEMQLVIMKRTAVKADLTGVEAGSAHK
jgi:hypothetical protein